MMLYRIKNLGEARTVTYLGVFTEGEEREFTQQEVSQYQNMNGVPLMSALDPKEFEVTFVAEEVGGVKEDTNEGEEG